MFSFATIGRNILVLVLLAIKSTEYIKYSSTNLGFGYCQHWGDHTPHFWGAGPFGRKSYFS